MWYFHITFVDPYVAAYISSSEILPNFHVIICSICYDFTWLRSRATYFNLDFNSVYKLNEFLTVVLAAKTGKYAQWKTGGTYRNVYLYPLFFLIS